VKKEEKEKAKQRIEMARNWYLYLLLEELERGLQKTWW